VIAAVVSADFAGGFVTGASQVTTPVAGRPILARTLARVQRVEGPDVVALLVPRDQTAPAEAFLSAHGLTSAVRVLPLAEPRPRLELLRAGRVWNLDGWRGGVVAATWFDEYLEPADLARVAARLEADTLACFSAYQPLLDADLASGQLRHLQQHRSEIDLAFTMAPPGLAGLMITGDAIARIREQGTPIGIEFAYRPEIPRPDPTTRTQCFQIDRRIATRGGRWTGDTQRSQALVTAALKARGENASAVDLVIWQAEHAPADDLPHEIELELTTADPLPETTLRPRGARVPDRTLADLGAVERLAGALGGRDDRLVVLGGCGDPLLHPDFARVAATLRPAARGLAVVTNLVELADTKLAALFETPVDLVQVRIDAHTQETYQAVHGVDAYDQVAANIQRLLDRRVAASAARPVVVCSLTRHSRTLADLEGFYDHWIRAGGWAVIEGYSRAGGLLPPDKLLSTTPPVRDACRRLKRRLMLHADGQAVACSEDAAATMPLGRWDTETLASIWAGSAREALYAAHAGVDLGAYPMCQQCCQWFRP
jgi:hypothetical protein